MKNAKSKTTKQTPAVAAQGPTVATGKAASKKAPSQKREAPAAPTAKKGGKTKPAAPEQEPVVSEKSVTAPPAQKANTSRAESKGAKILAMIARPEGATLAEIMKATEWQAHSVRGFISTAGKKQGVKIESSKDDSGARVYKIAK